MILFKNLKQFIFVIFILLLFGSQIQAQPALKSQGTSNSSSGRGVIVGKDGQAFKTGPNGQCQLIIPNWLFERIKKAPQKYSLKISVSKLPQKLFENKLPDSKKAVKANDTSLKFSYTIVNGNKSSKGGFSTLINKSNIGAISTKKFGLIAFSLSNPNTPNVDISLMYGGDKDGEPVPGAEIYVELEPDDEP
jgi:hypothetical protein